MTRSPSAAASSRPVSASALHDGRRPATGSTPVAGPAERAAVGHRADQPVDRRSANCFAGAVRPARRHGAPLPRPPGRGTGRRPAERDLPDRLPAAGGLPARARRGAAVAARASPPTWCTATSRAERRRYRALARAAAERRDRAPAPDDVHDRVGRRRRCAARSRRPGRPQGPRPRRPAALRLGAARLRGDRRRPSTSRSAPSAPGSTGPAGRPAPPSPASPFEENR